MPPWTSLPRCTAYAPGISYWDWWAAAQRGDLVTRTVGKRIEVNTESALEFARQREQKAVGR